ncbi:C40 family peptidase [Costertonia aggregata]|uniref:C40 family peptidase n=1 Tax=Costertonia aggregata TaxID=343403 RepID=A0A7H9ATN6_9FLAO|nr:C40 family peptidase [Costertonia aggregata]QLG46851.1 C40 family peptidase [Costertonia aggregata]
MKIKLLFFFVIVLVIACSCKSKDVPDYKYYKNEIVKAKKLQEEKKTVVTTDTSNKNKSYLSKEDKVKFANELGVSEADIMNEKLYHTIDSWLGVPYKWGGNSKKGIDCSAFVQQVYSEVYKKELPRTSIEQFYLDTKAHFKNQEYLKEGDLIFFRLRHKDKVVSHVGIYLQNGKFLGSNSPRGVEIVDLNSNYWQDKYVASSRLLNN